MASNLPEAVPQTAPTSLLTRAAVGDGTEARCRSPEGVTFWLWMAAAWLLVLVVGRSVSRSQMGCSVCGVDVWDGGRPGLGGR
jgi:hypothetical protein